jgi:ribosome maturation factor RimP
MTLDPAASSPARLLDHAVSAVVSDMGFELLLLEWLGVGKRRVLRVYLDSLASPNSPNSPSKGVTVEDCSRMSRIIGNALDAAEAAAAAGQGDPALAALLARGYTLEVSSPGVDRPLARRRHFEQFVGSKLRLETFEPLPDTDRDYRFNGRIVAVQDDPDQPADPEAALVVIADSDHQRTLHVPLSRIRRANLVWEG